MCIKNATVWSYVLRVVNVPLHTVTKAVQLDFFTQNEWGGLRGYVTFTHLKVTQHIPGCSHFLRRCKKAKEVAKGLFKQKWHRNATAVLLGRVQEAESKQIYDKERSDGINSSRKQKVRQHALTSACFQPRLWQLHQHDALHSRIHVINYGTKREFSYFHLKSKVYFTLI